MTNDNINRTNWKSFTNLVDIIIENDGVVFGGAVRDMISRDNASREFMKWKNDQTSDWMLLYSDITNHPESADRVMMPKDIDAVIHHTKLEKLLEVIKKNNFTVRLKWVRDAKNYLPNISVPVGSINHYRYVIRPKTAIHFKELSPEILSFINSECRESIHHIMNMASSIKGIDMDLMVVMNDESYDPPFSNLDFECNGLVLTKHGIRLSKYLLDSLLGAGRNRRCDPLLIQEYIAKIQKDIIDKLARPVYSGPDSKYPMDYRVEKMLEKNYKIAYNTIEKITEDIIVSEDGSHASTCIICHDDLSKDDHFKLKCCDARYHSNCLVRACFTGHLSMSQTHRCVMCRQDVSSRVIPEINTIRKQNILTDESEEVEVLEIRTPEIQEPVNNDTDNEDEDDPFPMPRPIQMVVMRIPRS